MEKISFIGIILTAFILPIVTAHEEAIDPGVTPDSFLWGLDKALDNLNLLLTLNPTEKAIKGIEIARERLGELKVMVEKNKLEAAEKSKDEEVKVLSKVKDIISKIKEKNATKQIQKEIEIEKELEEHEDEIKAASDNLKVKIEIKETLNEQQKALLSSLLSALENKTNEVKVEIKNKKDKTKIKIKQETGKSEKEIKEKIEDIEEEQGLSELKKEKAEGEIADAKEDLEELEKELEEHKAEGHVADEKPITSLMDNAKKRISNAELAFKSNDFGEAFGQANAAKQLIENAERVLEKIAEKFEEEEEEHEMEGETEIEVKIEDEKAKVKIEIKDEKLKFTLDTTDQNEIIQEIAERTGLSVDEVTELAEFEEEKEEIKQLSQELCEKGGGVWKGFPNSGKFCNDECNKPEKYACRKFMSMGCDCGDDKCWNGKSCEIEEKTGDWINDLIAKEESQPVANPPASLTKCKYKNQIVYYLPARCCDIFGVLYDINKNVICAPDGGFIGSGDGRCSDFFQERENCEVIWKDSRSYPSKQDTITINNEKVSLKCDSDEDCALTNKDLGFSCCWEGVCDSIDYSLEKYVAVNEESFLELRSKSCPWVEDKARRYEVCGPAPSCPSAIVNDTFASKCVSNICKKSTI